jgi:acetoacetyl-CoA synthetase
MREHGVKKGDRVAIVASNSVDTLKVFLAITALGGLFSSSSTDMGLKGILDRCLQIRPRFIFVDDGAVYNGKTIDLREKMTDIVNGMKGVAEFAGVVSMPRFGKQADIGSVPRTTTLEDFVKGAKATELVFEKTTFRDPFLIAYSSGTTGMPKCIVHSIGGVLLSSGKESKYHRETGPNDVALQYTTTGWIMYLTSVMNLQLGGRAVLYDGSPFLPDMQAFIKLVGNQKVTKLGISPRWMQEIQKAGIAPKDITDLSSLKLVTSTGMVLSDALFEWFYDQGFPARVHLANISGGTDLVCYYFCHAE